MLAISVSEDLADAVVNTLHVVKASGPKSQYVCSSSSEHVLASTLASLPPGLLVFQISMLLAKFDDLYSTGCKPLYSVVKVRR